MVKQTNINLDITSNADGFDVSGGTSKRKLTLSGADIGMVGSGTAVITFPSITSTLAILGANTFTADQTLGANNIIMTGSLGGTGAAKLTKGWFTDVEITNLPTINGGTLATALSLGTMASETATNYVAKSLFNAHTIIAATADDTPAALEVTEQTLVGRLTGGNISAVAMGIADNNVLQIDDADAAENDYCKLTTVGVVGRSYAEVLGDIGAAPATSPTFATSITGSYLTASEILITNADKNIVSAPVATYPSLTELSYVKGVTSAIQTQLGDKAPIASPTFTGTVTLPKTLEIQDTSADHQYVLAVSELTADRTVTLPLLTGNDTFVFNAHTATLTNKRITKRVVTTTDDATAVIDVDVTDVYELSAVANATEISVTGTPTDGQMILIRLKDAGAAKGLTWDAVFVAIGVTLPTTTVLGKWHYIGVQYNSAASKWHAISVSVQA